MCGICGIFGRPAPGRVESMVLAMRHRGPDDSGVFGDDGATLGMARLAIIDITPSGHQPMANPDGSIHIVYNGEAYNFQAEREILRGKGYPFASTSDTEVVLRMYEHYGDDFLVRMRGMFALALYDRRMGKGRERLLLARDPVGIKPLLYAPCGLPLPLCVGDEVAARQRARGTGNRTRGGAAAADAGFDPAAEDDPCGVRMLPPAHRLVIFSTQRAWEM